MADIIDKANDVAAEFLEKSLHEHKASVVHKFPYTENEDEFECYECGIVIPVLRRQLTGSEYCIDCKEDLDSRTSKGVL